MARIVQYMKDDMNKVYYKKEQMNHCMLEIARQMYRDDFHPDYIVGLTRGGLIPGVKLSHYLDIEFHALSPEESNLWIAEDAFNGKKILVIDDINDTGTTFNNLKLDWISGCMPDDPRWKYDIWHNTVKFASLINNEASSFDVDYSGIHINKNEKPEWCVFPWEQWW